MNKFLSSSLVLTISISVLMGSADNAFAQSIRNNGGFTTNILPGTDEGSVSANIGFMINFFGGLVDQIFVNNNGNTTFDTAFNDFDPMNVDFSTSDRKLIAAFFGDVDTRFFGNTVTYGQDSVDGNPAFGVNWIDVSCFTFFPNVDKLNSFQLVLIDRSQDFSIGDFDMELNYEEINWETGEASGGDEDCLSLGTNSAKIGYSDGTGTPPNVQANNFFEIAGSGIPGAFLDNGPSATSLIQNSLNSNIPGRYVIPVRDGIPNPQPQVEPEADLSIIKSDAADPLNPNDILTYIVTVTNNGPDPASNVMVTENLPAGVTFVSTNGCDNDPTGVPVCNLGDITTNNAKAFDIIVTVDSNTIGTITNQATVASDTIDPDVNNNIATEDTIIEKPLEPELPIGGEFSPIDSSALILAGLQINAVWMLPILTGVGVTLFFLKKCN